MAEAKSFVDQFSGHSSGYAKYRPGYPKEIYDRILEFGGVDFSQKGVAVDVGCGSGQATKELLKYFPKIFGVEPSSEQLSQAEKIDGIEYICSRAEKTPLPDQIADIVTSASAVHWFQLDEFWNEVDRLLRPGGVVAVWSYKNYVFTKNEEANKFYEKFLERIVKFWAPQLNRLQEGYKDIIPPFPRTERHKILKTVEISLSQYIGLLNTSSGYQNFIQSHPEEKLLEKLEEDLKIVYGFSSSEKKIEVEYVYFLVMGQKSQD